jgi:hypothetical protein
MSTERGGAGVVTNGDKCAICLCNPKRVLSRLAEYPEMA